MKHRRFLGKMATVMVVGLSVMGCTSHSESPRERTITNEVSPPPSRPSSPSEANTVPAPSAPMASIPLNTSPALPAGQGLAVANFDSGQKPNLIGGDFGSWDKDPGDPTQFCHISFDRANALNGAGYALKIDYDVDSPNPAYNGFWMKLQEANLSSSQALSFYVKGDPNAGYTPQIKLELKNAQGEVGHYLLQGITDEWKQVRIPLQAFAGLTDSSRMTELVIVFDDVTSTKKSGTIYLDDIAFQ